MALRPHLASILGIALVLSGCAGGDDEAPDDRDAGDDAVGTTQTRGPDGRPTNATPNATYLQNTDYSATHDHDYWGGASQLVLLNDAVEVSTFCCRFRDDVADPGQGLGGTFFSLPNNTFVPEGTGQLTFEVDATSAAVAGSSIIFGYAPRGGWRGEWTHIESSTPTAAWTVDIEPADADLPHARSTQWMFGVKAGANTVLNGVVNVKIVAHHVFDVEAWPAHPDFWQGGALNRLDLMNETVEFQLQSAEATRWFGMDDGGGIVTLPPGVLVPPETEALVVRFSWELSSAPENNLVADMSSSVKPGSSAFGFTGGWCFEVDEGATWKLYVIPVDETGWDSPYATESSWAFQIRTEGGVRADDIQAGFLGWAIQKGSGTATYDVKAYRQLPEWVEAAVDEEVRCFG